MSNKIIIPLGIVLTIYLLLSLFLAVFLLTGTDGVYNFFDLQGVLIEDDLLSSDRAPVLKKGDFATFSDEGSSYGVNDVLLIREENTVQIKRILYVSQNNFYVGIENLASETTVLDQEKVQGQYYSSSTFLYDLIHFSRRFYGVFVLFILPAVFNITFWLFLFNKKRKFLS